MKDGLWTQSPRCPHWTQKILPAWRPGRVTVGEDGGLQVEKEGDLLPFAEALPQEGAATSIEISAESLCEAVEG